MKLILSVADRHAPIKKCTVKTVEAQWIDDEVRNCMANRNNVKRKAIESGCLVDWQNYCKIRNQVTKLNRRKKRGYFQTRIN